MDGESASSSQQGTSNAPPTGTLSSSSVHGSSMLSSASGVASTTIGMPPPANAVSNVGSAQQNPQQTQIQGGSSSGSVAVGGQSNVTSGQMHQNAVPSQPSFQPGQSRPSVAAGRARQPSPYSHFSSMPGAGTLTSATHQPRVGVPMQGMGMSAQQKTQQPPGSLLQGGHSQSALGNPYSHNLQQPSMAGISRPGMISSGQSDMQSPYSTHQSRQKQGPIQSSPFPHSVSSGQPLQGMQTIGMMGSLGLSSQIRPGGVFGHNQQRPVQASMRSQSASQHQSLSSQKIPVQNLPRIPSLGPMGSQLSGMSQAGQSSVVSSSLPHQQQWLPAQGKQLHQSSLSSLASAPYQSHLKQQNLQRPHVSAQQATLPLASQQQQLQTTQQQQQQHQLHQSQEQPYQQLRMQQSVPVQQQIPRTPGLTISKSFSSAGAQPVTPASGATTPAGTNDQPTETGNQILGKRSIQELVAQIDPNEKLDPEVEDILIEIADDFVESVTTFACGLAKHRKSTTLEAKDVLLHLERNWHMTLPGFAGEEYKSYKRPFGSENHKQRLSVIRKSVATSQMATETGTTKGSAGQVTGNASSRVQAPKSSHEVPSAQELP